MPKRPIQKDQKRLWKSGQAEINRHERIAAAIAENKELQKELVQLRKRYKINFGNRDDYFKWLDSPYDVRCHLAMDVEALADKYHLYDDVKHKVKSTTKSFTINDSARKELWDAVWNFPPSGWVAIATLGGMPELEYSIEKGARLIITPETDITNQLVIKFITEWQKVRIKNHDKPPQPQPIKGSRKTDWMPVWEWSMKHPHITRKELADLLDVSYTHLKSKLDEIDKQKDLPITPYLFPSKRNM